MTLISLAGKILLSVLAVFGLYVLCRRSWLAWLGERRIVLAVRVAKNTADEELSRLVGRARDHAWLCGNCPVVLLPTDEAFEEF